MALGTFISVILAIFFKLDCINLDFILSCSSYLRCKRLHPPHLLKCSQGGDCLSGDGVNISISLP